VAVFAEANRLGLEGIIYKKADSPMEQDALKTAHGRTLTRSGEMERVRKRHYAASAQLTAPLNFLGIPT
jgi:hypothetical protein